MGTTPKKQKLKRKLHPVLKKNIGKILQQEEGGEDVNQDTNYPDYLIFFRYLCCGGSIKSDTRGTMGKSSSFYYNKSEHGLLRINTELINNKLDKDDIYLANEDMK